MAFYWWNRPPLFCNVIVSIFGGGLVEKNVDTSLDIVLPDVGIFLFESRLAFREVHTNVNVRVKPQDWIYYPLILASIICHGSKVRYGSYKIVQGENVNKSKIHLTFDI